MQTFAKRVAHHRKKVVALCHKRELTQWAVEDSSVSVGRACRVVSMQRSVWYYQSCKDDQEVINKLQHYAELYPTRGFDEY